MYAMTAAADHNVVRDNVFTELSSLKLRKISRRLRVNIDAVLDTIHKLIAFDDVSYGTAVHLQPIERSDNDVVPYLVFVVVGQQPHTSSDIVVASDDKVIPNHISVGPTEQRDIADLI